MNKSMEVLESIEAAAYSSGLPSFGQDTDDLLAAFQASGKEITLSMWDQIILFMNYDVLGKEKPVGML